MKGDKRSTLGGIIRKRLSDITNSQPQPKVLIHEEKTSQEKMTLMKLIEERNKIIELSGNELKNLRIKHRKLQLQNWNLAQSNSQIIAELNLGREKLKALQHELVCKDALLKAKTLDKEGKTGTNCANNGFQEEEKVTAECLSKANDKDKPCDRNRRRGLRSKSLGPSTTRRQVAEKESAENKKRCLRRQSARFKSHKREPAENLFEIVDTKLSVTLPLEDPMHEDGSIQTGSSTANEQTWVSINESQLSQKSSMTRPLRKAAEKVQSYKEVPVNVKMRRKE